MASRSHQLSQIIISYSGVVDHTRGCLEIFLNAMNIVDMEMCSRINIAWSCLSYGETSDTLSYAIIFAQINLTFWTLQGWVTYDYISVIMLKSVKAQSKSAKSARELVGGGILTHARCERYS